MYAFFKDVVRRNTRVLAGIAVATLISALVLDYLFMGRTLGESLLSWVTFLIGGSIGAVIGIEIRKRWMSRNHPSDNGTAHN